MLGSSYITISFSSRHPLPPPRDTQDANLAKEDPVCWDRLLAMVNKTTPVNAISTLLSTTQTSKCLASLFLHWVNTTGKCSSENYSTWESQFEVVLLTTGKWAWRWKGIHIFPPSHKYQLYPIYPNSWLVFLPLKIRGKWTLRKNTD